MKTNHSASTYVPALGYHWLTPCYDLVVGATTRERTFKQALLRQAAVESGHRVLDLACGTGTLALWIKQTVPSAEVTGADGDPRILALAREKSARAGRAVRFDQALSFNLPYADRQFDRVVSSLFFHHLVEEDKLRTLRELFRVLKPRGELHIADWGRPTNPVMRVLSLSIRFLDGFAVTRDNVNGRLPERVRAAGFVDVREGESFDTIFGTLTLHRARKP